MSSELWNPSADDSNAFTANGCFTAAPTYHTPATPTGTPLVAKVGDLTVPRTMYNGFDPTDTLRSSSGRDSDNNVIVYWSATQSPADNAACWLYVSRLNNWDENY